MIARHYLGNYPAFNVSPYELASPRELPLYFLMGLLVGLASPALAQERERLSVELEGGPVWQTRNDVRVPNDGGTDFSLVAGTACPAEIQGLRLAGTLRSLCRSAGRKKS